jgi:hypothetical protein
MAQSKGDGKDTATDTHTERRYEDGSDATTGETALMQKSPRTMYNEYIAANRLGGQRKELPTVRMDDPHYSSTAVMLKRTRAEVEAYNADLSVLNTIVDLPTSDEVRRTVAKIFADPRNAAAISDAEWKRREQAYLRNKERFSERVGDMLAREKAHMNTELSKLSD